MSEILALDWDDQQLVGVEARVGPKTAHLRKWIRIAWSDDELPSAHPAVAGRRLRAELEREGIATAQVIVSLPREDAVVRLLELPDCSDDELPDLVRFQAATRSSVPLDRLLLDFLPLPKSGDVPGRRVLMVTLGKPSADRITDLLAAAGLQAMAIRLSTIGAAEIVARQPHGAAADTPQATLIVVRSGPRIEIAVTWRNQIVLMHGATLSSHLTPNEAAAQILGETARSAVALGQAAPGVKIGSGWVLGSTTETSGLAAALGERFGFAFHSLVQPLETPGVRSDFDAATANNPSGVAPIGLLLAHSAPLIPAVDFLNPRKKVAKADRTKLRRVLAGAAAAVVVLGGFGALQWRMSVLDARIAQKEGENQSRQRMLENTSSLTEKESAVKEWEKRDIDWLEQFRELTTAMGSTDNVHFTSFDARVLPRVGLAQVVATGRAKTRNDVEGLNQALVERGYKVLPKEIVTDTADREFPQRINLNLELIEVPKQVAVTADVKSKTPTPEPTAPVKSAAGPTPETSKPGSTSSTPAPKKEESTAPPAKAEAAPAPAKADNTPAPAKADTATAPKESSSKNSASEARPR